MVFLVILDIRNTDPLVKERAETVLKLMGNWSNRLNGAWILETKTENARTIRDKLSSSLTNEDRLFVARISKHWAGRNMGQGFPEWLTKREFGTFTEGA